MLITFFLRFFAQNFSPLCSHCLFKAAISNFCPPHFRLISLCFDWASWFLTHQASWQCPEGELTHANHETSSEHKLITTKWGEENVLIAALRSPKITTLFKSLTTRRQIMDLLVLLHWSDNEVLFDSFTVRREMATALQHSIP